MQYAVVQKGEVVGMADLDDRYSPGEEVALQEAKVDENGAVEVFSECSETNERPCELTVILGMMQHLAEEAGVSAAEVDALEMKGTATEEEAKAAVCAVVARLPEDMQLQGQEVVNFGWGECGCDCRE